MTGNQSPAAHLLHDKATNCLWIACCGWNPSLSSSHSPNNKSSKNVTNVVWHSHFRADWWAALQWWWKVPHRQVWRFLLKAGAVKKSFFMCVLAFDTGWLLLMPSCEPLDSLQSPGLLFNLASDNRKLCVKCVMFILQIVWSAIFAFLLFLLSHTESWKNDFRLGGQGY